MSRLAQPAVSALVNLVTALHAAQEARYEPSVSEHDGQPARRSEATDATLATVLDERRWALSTEAALAETLLRAFIIEAHDQTQRLVYALARWNNE